MSDAPDAEPAALGETAYPVLKLKRHEDKRVAAGHLWIFSNEIDTAATPLTEFAPGSLAAVRSDRDRFLGYAYVNPHSLIAARILSRHAAYPPGPGLLVHRLRVALALRERLYASPHYRLVHGESDGLPGLVVDRYGATLVIQIGTAGMEAQKEAIVAALEKVVKPAVIVLKNDSGARDLEGLPKYVEAARGALPAELEILADGCRFIAPLAAGQKTGWFYDQAANRHQFLALAKGTGRVLDLFSYVGAWGVHAARGGAEVTCVDSSAPALEAAARNAASNGVTLKLLKADAFEALEQMHAARETFDLVIVDPPAFIKRRKDAGKGEAAYKRLNQLAMQLLARDGLLVSCSCSYHLEPDALLEAIQKAGRHLGRFVQVLASGGQSPDHPVHPAIRESRYLKAFLCRVTND
ncbi:MAG TPA: class I SAM-dependent rRNA methyltransferase [Steroidobacteraceae bacterium]|nr:class I SAM-dependent rRNA methyltransferase [Steroidobacteraceae bacterium]